MLQRIQTLFLFLIVVLSALSFFVPFQHISSNETSFFINLKVWDLAPAIRSNIYIPFAVNALILVLSLFTIFSYKNRPLQMILCRVIAFTSGSLIACFFSFTYINFTELKDIVINYSYVSFLPGLNVLLAYISKKFIKDDEELVRSADRIR